MQNNSNQLLIDGTCNHQIIDISFINSKPTQSERREKSGVETTTNLVGQFSMVLVQPDPRLKYPPACGTFTD
jgi:hypothetical protein